MGVDSATPVLPHDRQKWQTASCIPRVAYTRLFLLGARVAPQQGLRETLPGI